jgi:phosphatidylglycerophosphatase A
VASGADGLKTACITVLGSGFLRPAPGTWGSATACVLFAPVWFVLHHVDGWAVDAGLLAGILLASVLAVVWGEWASARFASKDPHEFVLDEFAGQWVSLLVLPIAGSASLWGLACAVGSQFFLFRVFDVLKPPPARQLERLPAGWGILFDDLAAGIYANLAGQALWRLTPLAQWLGVG